MITRGDRVRRLFARLGGLAVNGGAQQSQPTTTCDRDREGSEVDARACERSPGGRGTSARYCFASHRRNAVT